MVEPTIKAKLMLITGDALGGVAQAVKGSANDVNNISKAIGKAIVIPLTDVFGWLKKGIYSLAQASPVLAATLKEYNMGMRMLLMPIAETISNLLRPWILKFNRVAFKFYDDYQNGGFWTALKGALGEIGVTGALEIGAGLVIGSAVLGGVFSGGLLKGLGGMLGLGTTVGGTSLAIPAAFVLGSILLSEQLGIDGIAQAVVAISAGALFLIAGWQVAIPMTLAITGIAWLLDDENRDKLEKTSLMQKVMDYFGLGDWWNKPRLSDSSKKNLELQESIRQIQKGSMVDYMKDVAGGKNPVLAQLEMVKKMDEAIKRETISIYGSLEKGIISVGDTASTVTEKTIVPSMQDIGVGVDDNVTKVEFLNVALQSLPNIERTITYNIKYKGGSPSEGYSASTRALPGGGTITVTSTGKTTMRDEKNQVLSRTGTMYG